MKAFKYEDIIDKENNFVIGKKLTISLTGEFSHSANIVRDQDSFIIQVMTPTL